MKEYIKNILVPYLVAKREELGLQPTHAALALFDVFRGQCTEQILSLLEKHNVHFVNVPTNTTAKLQPLDISVNKSAKDFLREQFDEWYASKIMAAGDNAIVDLRLTILKPVSASWMIHFYDYIRAKPTIIKNEFRGAGISEALGIMD